MIRWALLHVLASAALLAGLFSLLTWLNEGGGPIEVMMLFVIYGFILTIWTTVADILALLVTETFARQKQVAVRALWAGGIVGTLIAIVAFQPSEAGSMVVQWPWPWRVAIAAVMSGIWFAIAFWLYSREENKL